MFTFLSIKSVTDVWSDHLIPEGGGEKITLEANFFFGVAETNFFIIYINLN